MTEEQYAELRPGQILWLNDPEKIYQVCEGQVELYAVTAADALHYRQTFIDLFGPGRLLFFSVANGKSRYPLDAYHDVTCDVSTLR